MGEWRNRMIERGAAKYYRVLLYVALMITSSFSVYDFSSGLYAKSQIEFLMFLGFLVVAIMLNRGLFTKQIMHITMLISLAGMLVIMVDDPVTAYWSPVLAVGAFSLFGKRGGSYWSALIIFCFALLLIADLYSNEPVYTPTMVFNIMASYAMATFIVYLLYKKDEAYYLAFLRETAERDRLEIAKTLAGGLAHLINNEMQAVVGNAEILMAYIHDKENAEYLKKIIELSLNASNHANQLLSYARGSAYMVQDICLDEMLSTLLKPWKKTLPENIHVTVDQVAFSPGCVGDPVQIAQVLMGILENAKEAIEERFVDTAEADRTRSGNITLSFQKELLKKDCMTRDMRAGNYIRISVKDNGCGICPSISNKIFEPFFSTKFSGRGMNLAAAYGIIKNHGGHIAVDSTPGQGSCFHIWLPAGRQSAEGEA